MRGRRALRRQQSPPRDSRQGGHGMRGMGAASLLVTLGVVLRSVSADEVEWRPARGSAAPPARLTLLDNRLGVTLGRPMPLLASPADGPRDSSSAPEIVPASYASPADARRAPVVRAKLEDVTPAMFPVGVELTADEPSPPSEEPEKSPAKSEPPAPQPTFHAATSGVVFPYSTTFWTRTSDPGPGSPFGAGAMDEDPGDVGSPPSVPCRFYGSAEYLLWWTRPANLPPLVTTGTPASQGILGQPGTTILFGGSAVDFGGQSGARFTAGYWLNCEQTVALEGSLFFLGQQTVSFNANSNMFPLLARPFFEINPGPQMGEFRQLTAFPNLFTGAIHASTASRLWGAEVDARCKGCCGDCCDCTYRIDWLAGVRYLELNDNLHVDESIQFNPGILPRLPDGGSGYVFDRFGTRNQFFGAQAGPDIQLRHDRWSLDIKAKVAVGDTHETVNINGGQILVGPGGAVNTFQGGLLALPSNIGHFTRDEFSVVPEIGLQVGYDFTPHLRAFVGYNFLYWSNVLRAGDQIDRNIDVTQIPNFSAPGAVPVGQTRPEVLFRETSFWAQGLNVGVEWKY